MFCSIQARGGGESREVLVNLAHQRRKGVGVVHHQLLSQITLVPPEGGTTNSFAPLATRVGNFQGPEVSGAKLVDNYACVTRRMLYRL